MKRWVLPVMVSWLAVALSNCGGGSHGIGVLPSNRVRQAAATSHSSEVLALNPSQYFKLDEPSGPAAVDSSATQINGSYAGNVSFGAPGPLMNETSQAIALPGGSASVGASLPNPNAGIGTSYSIETWVYLTSTSSIATIWGYSGTHRLLVNTQGQLLSQFGRNFNSVKTLSTGSWHDIVFVYDASAATESYYIDGAFDSSAPLANAYAAFTSAYYLGQYDTGVYYKWNGKLAQHAFYKTALSAAQIADLYATAGYGGTPTATPSPAATGAGFANAVLGDNASQYFKLDESAGPTAVDSSATKVNGTYAGAVTFGAAGPLLNQSSEAISLPGGSAGVGVSLPNPNAGTGTSYTIETWVYPNAASSFMTLWGFSGTHRLLLNPQGQLLSQFAGGFTSKGTLSRGQWHEVVFVYNAPAATESYYIDGVLDSSASLANTSGAFASAYYLGQYDTSVNYKWNGRIAQHAFFNTALAASQIANLYASAGYAGGTASPTPSPVPSYTDWNTYGDDLARTNDNPNETTLTPGNVSGLSLAWKRDLGAAITAQPLVATNVSIGGASHTVLYIGTEGGVFYALDAGTGTTLWSNSLGTVSTGCLDLPGGTFGDTATATYDKTTNRVYVSDGKDQVHALDMSTGAEASGWPVTLTNTFTKDHVYGAMTLNPRNGTLYVGTASLCDGSGWKGRIVAINTSTAAVTATFFPASPYQGAGIWGIGGAAIDSADNVYVSTGNDNGAPTEHSAFGDSVVQLSSTLSVISSNYPGLQGSDEDFGATPMIYQTGSCAQQVTVKNKSGLLFTYFTSSVSAGPMQSLSMAPLTATGQFIGTTAYSPADNLVYVGDPRGNSTFTHGLIALRPQSDCTLAPAWQQTTGPANDLADNNNSATVANGVVYFTDGVGNQVFAFNSATGQQLWNSGSIIGGPVMAAPTVDGRLFVSSYDHSLYAFTP